MSPEHHNNYKLLGKLNPVAARQSVIDYLESIGENNSRTATVSGGIHRHFAYDILDKHASGVPYNKILTDKCATRVRPAY